MVVRRLHGLLLILILGLFRHGKSVPIPSSYFVGETQNQDLASEDDVTESYERYPRNIFSTPYYLHENRWFPRSQVIARPRQPFRRRYHLFHLTSKHPNAVSYHVIAKPLSSRTINGKVHQAHQKYYSSSRSTVPYDVGQYQSYPTQPYYSQPATYQSPGYPSSGYPYSQTPVQDLTYQDILQEASRDPMQYPKNPSSYVNQQNAVQDDMSPLEEAAKQFKLASADMNNMELASLVMLPAPSLHGARHVKAHVKKHKLKQNNKKHIKKGKKMSKNKFHSAPKSMNSLVNKLIKNDKGKVEDDEMESDGSGSGSKDSWDEEDVSDEGFTSSKRSEIPHIIDTVSESDDKKTKISDAEKYSGAKDYEEDEKHENRKDESEPAQEYAHQNDVKDSGSEETDKTDNS